MKLRELEVRSEADRAVVRVSAGTFSGKAKADLMFVRVGRGVAAFAVTQVGRPFDPALETRLVRSVADRLAAGLRAS